jgi:hypothetical protein
MKVIQYLLAIAFSVAMLGCTSEHDSESQELLVVERDSPAFGPVVLVEAVGLEALCGVLTPLLQVGSSVPCRVVQVFSAAQDDPQEGTIGCED